MLWVVLVFVAIFAIVFSIRGAKTKKRNSEVDQLLANTEKLGDFGIQFNKQCMQGFVDKNYMAYYMNYMGKIITIDLKKVKQFKKIVDGMYTYLVFCDADGNTVESIQCGGKHYDAMLSDAQKYINMYATQGVEE